MNLHINKTIPALCGDFFIDNRSPKPQRPNGSEQVGEEDGQI